MLSKIEHDLNEYLRVRKNIILILSDAGSCERFLAKPNNRNVPSMYQLIETNYSTAIDLLLMIDESISDDPLLMRKILWLKATRNSYTAIGKYLVYHRTTIKRMYDNVLDKLANKIIQESLDIYDKKFI